MRSNLTRNERRLSNRLLAPGERSRTPEAQAVRDAAERKLQEAKRKLKEEEEAAEE